MDIPELLRKSDRAEGNASLMDAAADELERLYAETVDLLADLDLANIARQAAEDRADRLEAELRGMKCTTAR